MNHSQERPVTTDDYKALADFRHTLRRFLAFSEQAAKSNGLTAQQHQALLSIRGSKKGVPLTVGELAAHLLIRHHSAVELVDRLVKAGLVMRQPSLEDRRSVLLELTAQAEAILERLSTAHLRELSNSRALFEQLLKRLG